LSQVFIESRLQSHQHSVSPDKQLAANKLPVEPYLVDASLTPRAKVLHHIAIKVCLVVVLCDGCARASFPTLGFHASIGPYCLCNVARFSDGGQFQVPVTLFQPAETAHNVFAKIGTARGPEIFEASLNPDPGRLYKIKRLNFVAGECR